MSNEILAWSATELARRIRARELSPLEAVDAHIARIEAVNPVLNAVVVERFDAARAEARACDVGAGLPLAGVPFTVKEMIEVAGMPLTFGSVARRDVRGVADATAVERLRAAGAILLGTTNLPEWGMWFESYNDVYGRTSNPWDVTRTSGGSSGGEGSIVGAGGSAFGIGSDIGGSVRMPAAFCGVYGHKPSNGMLPLTGHIPVYRPGPLAGAQRHAPYVTLGTLTRSARDIVPLLRVMRGPDGVDPNCVAVELRDSSDVVWSGRRVLVLDSPSILLARHPDGPARDAVRNAAAVLEARGATVVDAPARLLRDANALWSAALQDGPVQSFAELVGGGRPVRLLPEMVRRMRGSGAYSWPALFFCLGEKLGRTSERTRARRLAELQELSDQFGRLVGDDGVLLMPAHPRVAPRHNAPILRPFDFLYTAVWNALRVPATVAPFGSEDGMPLSVQITSRYGNDDVTIAAALVLEEETGPWRVPVVKTT